MLLLLLRMLLLLDAVVVVCRCCDAIYEMPLFTSFEMVIRYAKIRFSGYAFLYHC